MQYILLSFSLSLLIVYVLTPHIIHIANLKNLFDEPGERKVHTKSIPRLGGLAVFIGFLFATLFSLDGTLLQEWNFLLCGTLIIFAVGFKDDIIGVSPNKKFTAQIIASMIVIFFGKVHLTNLHGILGIDEIPLWFGYLVTLIAILGITNAFNLIDGINGLLGVTGLCSSLTLGILFFLMGQLPLALIAFALGGAVLGFLRYNITPARVFMGDTGSLLLGFVLSVLTIKFVELNSGENAWVAPHAAPAIAIAVLIVPLFDTVRVFTLRILSGRSPFSADRNHIHHLLIDCGFSHTFASLILLSFNIFMIMIAFAAQGLDVHYIGLLMAVIVFSSAYGLTRFREYTLRVKNAIPVEPRTQTVK